MRDSFEDRRLRCSLSIGRATMGYSCFSHDSLVREFRVGLVNQLFTAISDRFSKRDVGDFDVYSLDVYVLLPEEMDHLLQCQFRLEELDK